MGKGNCLEKTRERRKISDETFVLHFFSDVERHVCCKSFTPVFRGYNERNHAAYESVLKFEVGAHFRSEEWVAVFDYCASGEEVYAISLEFASTGASEDVLPCVAVALYKAMDDRKERGYALDFIDNDGVCIGRAVNNFRQTLRIGLKADFEVFAQEIYKKRIRVGVAEPSRFSSAAWPEEEEVSVGGINSSFVVHSLYCSKASC